MCKRLDLFRILPVIALICACCLPAWCQFPETCPPETSNLHYVLAPSVGVFEPGSSRTRDTFGSTWFGVGITTLLNQPVTTPHSWHFDLAFYGHSDHGNSAYLVPIGVDYQRPLFGKHYARVFWGVSADAVFTRIKDEGDNIPGLLRIAPGGSAYLGLNIGRRWQLIGRYVLMQDIEGFNFSGAAFSVAYRL